MILGRVDPSISRPAAPCFALPLRVRRPAMTRRPFFVPVSDPIKSRTCFT